MPVEQRNQFGTANVFFDKLSDFCNGQIIIHLLLLRGQHKNPHTLCFCHLPDRSLSVERRTGTAVSGAEFPPAPGQTPVSYTHLDVYKRQG